MSAFSAEERPKSPFLVYAVLNGNNILQLGHGDNARALLVVRGSLAGKHNKAFICSLGEAAIGGSNEYVYIPVPDKDTAKRLEIQVHRAIGIDTNRFAATWLEYFKFPATILEIHQELWRRFVATTKFKNLTDVEKILASQLFEYVTFAKTRIERNIKTVKSGQGDNLEGNIMKNVERNHLIPIYQKITNLYHRYGIHTPTNAEMSAILSQPLQYSPKGQPFEIRATKTGPVTEYFQSESNLIKYGLY